MKSMKICSAEKLWLSSLNDLLARGTVYISGIFRKFLKAQSSEKQWKKSQLEPLWEFPSLVEGALCIPHASQPCSWGLEQLWTLCVPEYILYMNIFHFWQCHTLRGQHWGQTQGWGADHGNYSEYSPDLQLFLFWTSSRGNHEMKPLLQRLFQRVFQGSTEIKLSELLCRFTTMMCSLNLWWKEPVRVIITHYFSFSYPFLCPPAALWSLLRL